MRKSGDVRKRDEMERKMVSGGAVDGGPMAPWEGDGAN